jgi:hypothetical protein
MDRSLTGVYSESGVDLTLLRDNLRRPLDERLRQNARMVQLCEVLRQANPRRRGEQAGGNSMAAVDLQAIVKVLVEHEVEFVLIGGLAMIYHGSSHVTVDVDVCYARNATNLQKIAKALEPFHPYMRGAPPGLPFRFDALTIQAGLNFTLTTDLGPLDLLGEVSGVGAYGQARAKSEQGNFLGFAIQVLSIDGLIAAKMAAGRFKDQSHLLELEELKKLQQDKRPEST